jgi:hypothetical protein
MAGRQILVDGPAFKSRKGRSLCRKEPPPAQSAPPDGLLFEAQGVGKIEIFHI